MRNTSSSTLFERLVDPVGWLEPFESVQFFEGEVVSAPRTVEVTSQGGSIKIPTNTCGVLYASPVQVLQLLPGNYRLYLPPGLYQLLYVDTSSRINDLPEISALTKDAYTVRLRLAVTWRVNYPRLVVDMQAPLRRIVAALTAAVVDFIQTRKHDQLVSAGHTVPIEGRGIAAALRSCLKDSPAFRGFELLDVNLLSRQGDPRRAAAAQEAELEAARIQAALQIQGLRAQQQLAAQDQEAIRLRGQAQVLKAEGELQLQRAQIDRRTAEDALEERVAAAEIEAKVARILRPVQIQTAEMQWRANLPYYQNEQALELIRARAQAFGQILSAFAQPNAADPEALTTLARAAEILAQNLSEPPALPEGPAELFASPGIDEVHPPTVMQRVAAEMNAVLTLPDTSWQRVESIGPGQVRVVINHPGASIIIECGSDFPEQPPLRVLARKESLGIVRPLDLNLAAGLSLREIVLMAIARLAPTPQPVSKRGNGGATSSHPVAG
jgi:hypothetical protein